MGMARSKMAYSWQVGRTSTGRWPLRAARTCRDIAATSLIWSSHIRSTVGDFQIPSYVADNLGPVPDSDRSNGTVMSGFCYALFALC